MNQAVQSELIIAELPADPSPLPGWLRVFGRNDGMVYAVNGAGEKFLLTVADNGDPGGGTGTAGGLLEFQFSPDQLVSETDLATAGAERFLPLGADGDDQAWTPWLRLPAVFAAAIDQAHRLALSVGLGGTAGGTAVLQAIAQYWVDQATAEGPGAIITEGAGIADSGEETLGRAIWYGVVYTGEDVFGSVVNSTASTIGYDGENGYLNLIGFELEDLPQGIQVNSARIELNLFNSPSSPQMLQVYLADTDSLDTTLTDSVAIGNYAESVASPNETYTLGVDYVEHTISTNSRVEIDVTGLVNTALSRSGWSPGNIIGLNLGMVPNDHALMDPVLIIDAPGIITPREIPLSLGATGNPKSTAKTGWLWAPGASHWEHATDTWVRFRLSRKPASGTLEGPLKIHWARVSIADVPAYGYGE